MHILRGTLAFSSYIMKTKSKTGPWMQSFLPSIISTGAGTRGGACEEGCLCVSGSIMVSYIIYNWEVSRIDNSKSIPKLAR